MDDATVSRGHGVEGDRISIGDRALGHALSECAQLVHAALAVLCNVEGNPGGAALGSAEHHVHEELKRAQRLATVSYEQPGVLALDIDHGLVVEFASFLPDGCIGVDVEQVEEIVNDVEGSARGAVVAVIVAVVIG